jgi:hypothetical protein
MSRILIIEACEKRRLDLLRFFGRKGWEVDAPNTVPDDVIRLGASEIDVVLVAFNPSDPGVIGDIARLLEKIRPEPISARKMNPACISP